MKNFAALALLGFSSFTIVACSGGGSNGSGGGAGVANQEPREVMQERLRCSGLSGQTTRRNINLRHLEPNTREQKFSFKVYFPF